MYLTLFICVNVCMEFFVYSYSSFFIFTCILVYGEPVEEKTVSAKLKEALLCIFLLLIRINDFAYFYLQFINSFFLS